MNIKKKELDVDFIGGQEPLTPQEEKALSDFFKQQLQPQTKKNVRQLSVKKRTKISI